MRSSAARRAQNVVVVTPTASGKTLCYNLPVLQRLIDDPGARAMYLFPTKALAEDQLHEFQAAVDAMGSEIRAFTYDGDTPQDARRAIRERANVVLTNPDMLHSGILPHHTKWAKCFENLRYVVIDELHYYRGVYGSHLANVLRRLRRICEFYGSKPQFICCSATIANPKELAEALTGGAVRAGGSQRRAQWREILRVLQSAGGEQAAWHPARVFAGDAAHRDRVYRAASADAGVRQQPPGDRDSGEVFARCHRARAVAGRCGARLPGRLFAARAARDRTQAARWRDPGGGGDECAGAGRRHRIAGRGGDGRLSGFDCVGVAAGRARGTAADRFAGGDGGIQRAAGSIRGGASGVFLRRVARARAHQRGQSGDPAQSFEVRRV